MGLHRGYQGAVGCSSGPQPGVVAFAAWYLGAYGGHTPAAANLGIFLCRQIAGSGTWSLHAEGRAFDAGTAPYSRAAWSRTLMTRLRDNSLELGIQCIIYDRQIWSGSRPDDGWRPYNGSNPHTGHGHIEFSWAAARDLTAADVERVIGGGGGSAPTPPASGQWPERLVRDMRVLNLSGVTSARGTWVTSDDVGTLQGMLLSHEYGPAGLVNSAGLPDRTAGPATRRMLGEAQTRYRTGSPSNPDRADFVAGEQTFRALLRLGR